MKNISKQIGIAKISITRENVGNIRNCVLKNYLDYATQLYFKLQGGNVSVAYFLLIPGKDTVSRPDNQLKCPAYGPSEKR